MVDPMAVDLHRFRRLVGHARTADDDDIRAARLEQALALWRGPALGSLDTLWVNSVRDAVDRELVATELDRNDLGLRRGRHAELLAELLAELITAADRRPLDERLAGQLLVALYRCGRQAYALEHHRQIRLRLADELGVDPSHPLITRMGGRGISRFSRMKVPYMPWFFDHAGSDGASR